MALKRLYESETSVEKFFTPVYKSGEIYSFYINFDEPITDPDFDNFKLGVYTCDGDRVNDDVAVLVKSPVNDFAYNILCIFAMPTLANGRYRFGIYNSSDEIKCTSNLVLVENEFYDRTSIIEWSNRYNCYNYYYENHPNFKNKFRVLLIEIDDQFESDMKQYRAASNRKLRNVRAYLDRTVKLQTFNFDKDAHEAMAVICQHDTITINDVDYIAKTGYNIDTDKANPVFSGTAELYLK